MSGEASPSEVRSLADHTLVCSTCATAWQLAQELNAAASASSQAVRPRSRWGWPSALIATAAGLVLALGLFWQRAADPPNLRRGAASAISTPLATGSELPRDALILRWKGPRVGLRYNLWVMREDLVPITKQQDLSSTSSDEVSFHLEAQQVSAVPPGGKILWRVETLLPDGTPLASETFVVRVK